SRGAAHSAEGLHGVRRAGRGATRAALCEIARASGLATESARGTIRERTRERYPVASVEHVAALGARRTAGGPTGLRDVRRANLGGAVAERALVTFEAGSWAIAEGS